MLGRLPESGRLTFYVVNCIWGHIKLHLRFLSFVDTEMAHVVEIRPKENKDPCHSTLCSQRHDCCRPGSTRVQCMNRNIPASAPEWLNCIRPLTYVRVTVCVCVCVWCVCVCVNVGSRCALNGGVITVLKIKKKSFYFPWLNEVNKIWRYLASPFRRNQLPVGISGWV